MFEKGSEWRRWDLHIHTPETNKNDNYQGCNAEEKWDNFYESIEAYIHNSDDNRRQVAVIGITDYLSIDNYKKVIKDNKLPKEIMAVFPNVEMRIVPMGQKSPVNIHFIFNPEFVDSLESRFFAKLSFNNGDRSFTALKDDLIALGKTMLINATEEEAYHKGVDSFIPSYKDISELFSNDLELRENTLIGVANKSTDGASGIDRGEDGDQLTASKWAVYKLCDFIFSANPKDIDYFVGKGVDSEDEVIQKYGSLKPCFHGCDAHDNSKIFEPTNARYCWIKADPTFNGLRQVIYEPMARVRIDSLKPEEKSDYQVIEKVVINDPNFGSTPIVFNDRLTCIIGGKSTGKSLLLQNMARAIDEKQVVEKLEVSKIKSKKLESVNVFWKDGDMNTNGEYDQTHKIVYIPQTYLNRLTDEGEQATEIDKIIQDIVLINDECSNAYETMESNVAKQKPIMDKQIYDLLQIAGEMQNLLEKRNEIGTESGITKELQKLVTQKNIVSEDAKITEDELKAYDAAIRQVSECAIQIERLNKEIEVIKELKLPIQLQELPDEIIDERKELILQFQNDFIEKAEKEWAIKKGEVFSKAIIKRDEIENKKREAEQIKATLEPKVNESDALAKLSEQIKGEEEKLKKVQSASKMYYEKKAEYEKMIEFVAEMFEQYKVIRKRYADIVNRNSAINSEGLEFKIEILFRNESFCNNIRTSINNSSLKKLGVNFEDDFSEENLDTELIKRIVGDIISGELKLLKNKSKESVIRDLLSDWTVVSYTVNMENDSIGEMSPGKKALVLLKLLISLADSKCPILIDQPEDDLDNRSIFDELIPFIREKKVIRQIIIVTHNANVVLGGDADEIIVANQNGNNAPNCTYRFEYRSGSIENDSIVFDSQGKVKAGVLNSKGIQQHICDILEGGEKAFDLRKHKYRI